MDVAIDKPGYVKTGTCQKEACAGLWIHQTSHARQRYSPLQSTTVDDVSSEESKEDIGSRELILPPLVFRTMSLRSFESEGDTSVASVQRVGRQSSRQLASSKQTH